MWRRTLALLAAVLAIPLAFELGFAIAVETGWVRTPRPSRSGSGFWKGQYPVFGVWHAPDAVRQHTSRCFRVEYRTNSVGMRDVERSRLSRTPRVAVLGDSFLAGWGLHESERLSNLLERETGIPHLNFAMAHFGPYQALLAYRKLGCRDLARVDFMLDDRGPWVLEVNTMPGFTTHSLVPRAAASLGRDMPRICSEMVETALARADITPSPMHPATP